MTGQQQWAEAESRRLVRVGVPASVTIWTLALSMLAWTWWPA